MAGAWSGVYILVKRIPKGRVITYGQLARATRLPGGARAAGRAMAACPRGQAIPWHRVIAAGGRIAVREPFAGLQRRLLESEGIRLVNGRVPLADHPWAPPKGSTKRRPKRSTKLVPRKRASKKPSK
jgi:methylated-DNA-protein-cysteine methyltransferase-like protein